MRKSYYIELVQYSAQPTIVSLIFTVVFNVLLLTGFNQLFKRFLPQMALSQGELLVIYVMLSVASATAGHSMMEILVSTLGHAFWFATPENDWKDLFWRYIPNWLAVADKGVLSGYYEGDSTLYTKQHLLGWLTPVMNWFAFLFAMLFVMVCINLIVRKPWTEDENSKKSGVSTRLSGTTLQRYRTLHHARSRGKRRRSRGLGRVYLTISRSDTRNKNHQGFNTRASPNLSTK